MSTHSCIICYEELIENNLIHLECCLKKIHIKCLHEWVINNKNKTCPFCRFNLSTDYESLLHHEYLVLLAVEQEEKLQKERAAQEERDKMCIPIPKSVLLSTFDGINNALILRETSCSENDIKYQLFNDKYILLFQVEETQFEVSDLCRNLIVSLNEFEAKNFEIICKTIASIIEINTGISDLSYQLPMIQNTLTIKESYPFQYKYLIHDQDFCYSRGSFEFAFKIVYIKGKIEIECHLIHAIIND